MRDTAVSWERTCLSLIDRVSFRPPQFRKASPDLQSYLYRRYEGNLSALKVNETGLVVVREFWWYRAALVTILPDIVKLLSL